MTKNYLRCIMSGSIPGIVATVLVVVSWRAWAGVASLDQYRPAARIILDGVVTHFGSEVAVYLRACPSMLISVSLTILCSHPLSAVAVALAARPTETSVRNNLVLMMLSPALTFAAHAAGAVACVLIVPGQGAGDAFSWMLSLWLRTSSLLLPVLSLALAAGRIERSAMRIVCVVSFCFLWALTLGQLSVHPESALRTLVLSIELPSLIKGVLGCVVLAASIQCIPILLRSFLSLFVTRFEEVLS
jgi:hypothetical protein